MSVITKTSTQTEPKRLFSHRALVANSLVAAAGAGAAAFVAVPSSLPFAVGAAIVGAFIAYTATSKIPDERH